MSHPVKILFVIIVFYGSTAHAFAHASTSPTMENRIVQVQQDSLQVITRPEQKQRLNKALNHVTLTHKKLKPKDVNERIVNAEYATFKLLLIIGRAIDKPGTFGKAMNEEEIRFTESDKKNRQTANQMVNGFAAMYSMYGMFAQM